MKLQFARQGLLTLSAIVIFIFLSIQTQRLDEQLNSQYRSDLRQLEGLHAALNEDVLRARLGLLTYFDPLNTTLDDLGQVRNRLGLVPSFVGEPGQREIIASLESYDALMLETRELIERFKTENAVLINSLSYFTIVVSDLTRQTATNELESTVIGSLNSLLQDILLYNTTGNEDLRPSIHDHIFLLLSNQDAFDSLLGSADAVSLDALINHANLILQRKPVTDGVIEALSALPISQKISEISSLYNTYYQAARQSNILYQLALYIFSLAVVGYIAVYIIMKLRKSAAVLHTAKEELQATYTSLEKRTEELELANVEMARANEEAREANRLKDEFLAVMSHELRTPLNAIIGFQGILLMSHKLDERATHMIERAQSNAERLLSLINNILDISRIESGRLRFAIIDLSVGETVEKWRSQMSILAEQKGVGFSVHIDEALPRVIRADEDAITKIVTNLLGNAFKFTENGNVTLDLKRSNGNWIIEVQDTGIGIPVHMQQVIFERFRQVDSSSKRKYGGSGLGLAIVHNLCKAMNGSIVVRSEPGHGSTFTVTLPLEVGSE